MTIFNELQALLEKSFLDRRLDSQEKAELHQEFQGLSNEQRAYVRNQAFKLTKTVCDDEAPRPLFRWLEAVIKSLDVATITDYKSEVYFSPGQTCAKALVDIIHNAKKSLAVCVFTISENGLRDALIAAAKRGIAVRIITDNDKTFDRGSDINELADRGFMVRTDTTSNHMHHKFVIADEACIATGSFNWTRSASLYNHENLVVLNDSELVARFVQEFTKIWGEAVKHQV